MADKGIVVRSVAVAGSPRNPGDTVTKEEAGASWDKWVADGSIAVGKDAKKAEEAAPEPTVAMKAEAAAAEASAEDKAQAEEAPAPKKAGK